MLVAQPLEDPLGGMPPLDRRSSGPPPGSHQLPAAAAPASASPPVWSACSQAAARTGTSSTPSRGSDRTTPSPALLPPDQRTRLHLKQRQKMQPIGDEHAVTVAALMQGNLTPTAQGSRPHRQSLSRAHPGSHRSSAPSSCCSDSGTSRSKRHARCASRTLKRHRRQSA